MSGATAHDSGGAQAARFLPPMGESVRDVGADDVEHQAESPSLGLRKVASGRCTGGRSASLRSFGCLSSELAWHVCRE